MCDKRSGFTGILMYLCTIICKQIDFTVIMLNILCYTSRTGMRYYIMCEMKLL